MRVHSLEIVGTIIVVFSAIICMSDSESSKASGGSDIVKGDIIAIISVPFYAAYFVVNSRLVKKIPAMLILHLIGLIQYILVTGVILMKGEIDVPTFFSKDPVQGMFGWASEQYLLTSLLLIGPFAGLIGCGSYIFMLDYFPSHIVANIFLLEPVSCQFLGIILGQDNMPGMLTYVGALGILCGLALTMKGDRQKEQDNTAKEDTKKEELELELI